MGHSNPTFTMRHHRALARVMAATYPRGSGIAPERAQWRRTVTVLADVLAADNPRFSRETFADACGGRGGDAAKMQREAIAAVGDVLGDIRSLSERASDTVPHDRKRKHSGHSIPPNVEAVRDRVRAKRMQRAREAIAAKQALDAVIPPD